MNQRELEKYLWEAATSLRGKIDAGDYKQFIFPLLFYKRLCDVYDEEYTNALKKSNGDKDFAEFDENHNFKIPTEAHWNKIREVTENVGSSLQIFMKLIEEANPQTLTGIFGDGSWTNKDRLSDETLINLIDHFSKYSLDIKNVPDDQLGDAYEYLIKKFADDSGHTAAEFYTNRTVVKLMTMIMNPRPGESIYDPTCGSGGLLLNCALHLKNEKKEYRSLKLYGQEINLITSSIARMNMFIHGVEEFKIVRGNTLNNPAFIEKDKLQKFDIILANPPYSIKSWNQKEFSHDPFGRNIWGTPPKACADYAFQQHIQKSLKLNKGRSISLWPHGILFREKEQEIRCNMIQSDLVECVIGLGPNLFYNSPMESCLLITTNNKSKDKKGKILFINAVNEINQHNSMSYLDKENIKKIYNAYKNFKDIKNFCLVVENKNILSNKGNMSINLYIQPEIKKENVLPFEDIYKKWKLNSENIGKKINNLFKEI